MESQEDLPIIVVSAADAAAADKFISELIGEEEEAGARGAGAARVWRLTNKYYRARVALLARSDGDPPPAPAPPRPPPADAHLVLLDDHECSSGAALWRRVSALSGAGGAPRVRLALAADAGPWVDAARAVLYEPVPLRSPLYENPEDSEDEATAGPLGLERVREALHAHTWRSLRLHGDARPPPALAGSSSDTDRSGSSEEESESEWSGWQSATAGQAERVASQFAAALGVLSERGAGGGPGAGDARLLRAEALLAALRPPAPPRHPPP